MHFWIKEKKIEIKAEFPISHFVPPPTRFLQPPFQLLSTFPVVSPLSSIRLLFLKGETHLAVFFSLSSQPASLFM